MSTRTFYLIGLLGIVFLTAVTSVVFAATNNLGLASSTIAWGAPGAFLWGIFKESEND